MDLVRQEALLGIMLMAAFADGGKDERERQHIRESASSLGGTELAARLPALMQDVLLKRADLSAWCARLTDQGERLLAYEMAVCVCDADGVQSPAEVAFLADLSVRLGITGSQAAEASAVPDGLAQAAGVGMPAAVAAGTAAAAAASVPQSSVPSNGAAIPATTVNKAEVDRMVLTASILNGALELLPQTWATMAIVPLQMRLVYRIGKLHGHELDRGHITEFLATAGVGLASQYVEQMGRRLVGGLLGKVAGGFGRSAGSVATGVAMSFATTYALGQLAHQYYAGGRKFSTDQLRSTFQSLLGPAREMQTRYLPEIQQRARTLDAGEVMRLVRGG